MQFWLHIGRHYSTIYILLKYNFLMGKLVSLRSGYVDIMLRVMIKKKFPLIPMHSLSSQLKQNFLLVDQIGIYEAFSIFERLKQDNFWEADERWLEELELELLWLKDNNVLFEIESYDYREILKNEETEKLYSQVIKDTEKTIKQILSNPNVGIDKLFNYLIRNHAITLRMLIADYEVSKGISAVSAFGYEKYTFDLPNTRLQEITQVIIPELPLPSGDTPWEQIIDYRNDPDVQNDLFLLRHWITKKSFESQNVKEVINELEWLIHQFNEHMKFHRIKANKETFEAIVKLPFELGKLNISKLPETLFLFKTRQLALIEAEMSAPGRELAYLVKAKMAFPPSG